MQPTQLVAQKFTSTTLPRRLCMEIFSPFREVNVTCGAAESCDTACANSSASSAASASKIRKRLFLTTGSGKP